ncbi:hypothetical protein [Paenibacillus sophorae]|uniref:Uncharacterized protein n=1 Tax=Paenibacillus sophorae TaxID=1333845 RepID=A0ABX8H7S8_9BACL|nr:hypothetical protein [Paenibacillus sophorae]QWU13812.1 hypothetical protein KP014_17800 [Paenibacillus sophorae]
MNPFTHKQLVPEWAVLRPSYFFQNFTEGPHGATINRDGVIISATGPGRVGFVDADDIAHNTDHIITGPHSLSYAETGEIIGAASGRIITHVHIDLLQPLYIISGADNRM